MADVMKQRVCIEFCVKLGKTANKICRMLKSAFEEETFSRTTTFKSFARFKEAEFSSKLILVLKNEFMAMRLSTSHLSGSLHRQLDQRKQDRGDRA